MSPGGGNACLLQSDSEIGGCLGATSVDLAQCNAQAVDGLLRQALREEEQQQAAASDGMVVRWSVRIGTKERPCTRTTRGRPGPDLVATIACVSRPSKQNNEAEGRQKDACCNRTPFDIACGVRRRLAGAPQIGLLLVEHNGVIVTSAAQVARQLSRGMRQCEGCGAFFSHQGKGLATHQVSAKQHACHEAGVRRAEREAVEQVLGGDAAKKGGSSWREAGRGGGGGGGGGGGSLTTGGPPEVLCLARNGCLPQLQAAAARGTDIAGARDRHGSGPLLWAAGAGHMAVCRWLVEELGIDAAATRRKDGRTALHWAARNGRLEVCRYLTERGVDPHALTYDGDSLFMLAAWQGVRLASPS